MTILETLEYIPDITWNRLKDVVTFLGAGIAFSGIFFQMAHNAREARKQREMELRKQVYFQASESLAQMSNILGTIGEPGTQTRLNSNVAEGLYKLHLVADNELIKKLVKCGQYFGNAIFDIVCDRLVIENLTTQADHALNMHKMHLDQFNRLSQAYTNSSQETILEIMAEQEELSKKFDICMAHHERAISDKMKRQLDLSEKSLAHICEFSILMAECVVDIRRDLESPFTLKESIIYKSIMLESVATVKKTGTEFLSKVRSRIQEFNLPDL